MAQEKDGRTYSSFKPIHEADSLTDRVPIAVYVQPQIKTPPVKIIWVRVLFSPAERGVTNMRMNEIMQGETSTGWKQWAKDHSGKYHQWRTKCQKRSLHTYRRMNNGYYKENKGAMEVESLLLFSLKRECQWKDDFKDEKIQTTQIQRKFPEMLKTPQPQHCKEKTEWGRIFPLGAICWKPT